MHPETRLALYCHNMEDILPALLNKIALRPGSWHCVVIDDGSTDGSGMIIRKFVDADDRFRYVFQQHQGRDVALAVAREVLESSDMVWLEM